MQKLVELEKDETVQVSSNILNYEQPDAIYLPLENSATLLVKLNESVKIGNPIYKTKTEVITSPISGVVESVATVTTLNGPTKALKIRNDFEEQKRLAPASNIFHKLSKDHLTKLLKLQFKIDMTNIDTLILNAIDDDIYTLTSNFYLLLYYEGFLELLDEFFNIFSLKRLIICVKETSGENITKLMECLGMYPNIELKIVPNLYLLGENSILINYLELTENNPVAIKTNAFYDIYNLIKRNRQKTDKLITISGICLKNPSIIKVKVGTNLQDIITNLITLTSSDIIYIANGLLKGTIINPDHFIIDDNIDSILIMPKKEPPKEGKCINCGACENICPVGLNPLLFANPTYYTKAQTKCLKCGLCSYICPVYINFNKYERRSNHE